jgi:predicted GIY-YIG superfamily endonuclease
MITYLARNTRNGKFYIGSTVNFESRKKQHIDNQGPYPFHRALRANPDIFEWETYEDESEGRELEQALLDMFFGTEMCYNLSPYAIGGCLWRASGHCWVNDGSKERYIEVGAMVEEGWNYGRLPVSEEMKEKLRQANTGKIRPECATAVGRVWVTNFEKTEEIYLKPGEEIPEGWVKGRRKFPPRSEESRQRTSNALKGKPKSDSHKQNLREATLNYYANQGKTL